MKYDALVVGGSYAGLTAALYITRARKRVLVIDSGSPRNRTSEHSHGLIAQDGRPGSEILDDARRQLSAYPTVTLKTGRVVSAAKVADGFVVECHDGSQLASRAVLLATGVIDLLPEVPGLIERWGKTVLHCPYCHGYEIGGGSIGVLASSSLSVHQATLVADWGDVTLFTNAAFVPTSEERETLRRRKVAIESVSVLRLEGTGPAIDGMRLDDGRLVPIRALFTGAPIRMASPLAEQLGCEFEETPMGSVVRVDARKQTTVPGVYAAGDMTRMQHSITLAAADGVLAGVGLHAGLIAEDLLVDQ